jgi:hypothetical protein
LQLRRWLAANKRDERARKTIPPTCVASDAPQSFPFPMCICCKAWHGRRCRLGLRSPNTVQGVKADAWCNMKHWSLFLLLCCFCSRLLSSAHAHDNGQWEHSDPETRAWFQTLMQPDAPQSSCCGQADGYWCDSIHVVTERNGVQHTTCTITDDRPDDPLVRPHVDIGTVIDIPTRKLKWDKGNPTGHAIVFMSRFGDVFCFVQNGGT